MPTDSPLTSEEVSNRKAIRACNLGCHTPKNCLHPEFNPCHFPVLGTLEVYSCVSSALHPRPQAELYTSFPVTFPSARVAHKVHPRSTPRMRQVRLLWAKG